MSTSLIMVVIVAYFGLLFIISHFTSRNAGNSAFFLEERRSPWYVVAFGMIGASLVVSVCTSGPWIVPARQLSDL